MRQCKWIKKNGEQYKNNAAKQMEYCRTHQLQRVFQILYDEGLAALDANNYPKAIDRFSLIQELGGQYKDASRKLSEAQERMAQQTKKSKLQVPDWAYLGILFGAIYALLGALFENSFALLLSVSRLWGIRLLLVHFVCTLVIVLWTIRLASKSSAEQTNGQD